MKLMTFLLACLFQLSSLTACYDLIELAPTELLANEDGLFVEVEENLRSVIELTMMEAGYQAVVLSGIGDICIRCREGLIICEQCWGCSSVDCSRRCRCEE